MLKKSKILFLSLSSLTIFLFLIIINSLTSPTGKFYINNEQKSNQLTIISENEPWPESINTQKITKGKKITGTFISNQNNLGIIAVTFDADNRSIKDKVAFRIKETKSKNWYFQSEKSTDQFQTDIPFPFGFPIINNSKNISYTFEIESLSGTPKNSISISNQSNFFITKHKYSKSEMLKNPQQLLEFTLSKIKEQSILIMHNPLTIPIVLSPFILYILFSLLKKLLKKLEKKANKKIKLKIFKPINLYKKKIYKLLAQHLKKISIYHPLDRITKIRLTAIIICAGFISSTMFHYIQGLYFQQPYPFNTFLPSTFYGDFFGVFDEWSRMQFDGVGYGLSYFPATYLIIDLLVKAFTIHTALAVHLFIFTIFMIFYTYKNVRTDSKSETILYSLIISLLSYPFLFTFQTANLEIITFIFVSLFFIFYSKKPKLGIIFLAYAISMKAFPAIFLTLLLLEKKYKHIFMTLLFVAFFTILPLTIFDGGFNKGIDNYLNNLSKSQNMYSDLMIISGAGTHYGHSMLNGLRAFSPELIPSIKNIMLPYEISILIITIAIIAYLFIFEKTYWRKVACLVMMLNLFPFTSTDYKLMYIFLPLFFLINNPIKNKFDLIFIVLLSLLLIPKDYFHFNQWPLATFNVVSNPIIMLIILLLIIFLGLKSSKKLNLFRHENKRKN